MIIRISSDLVDNLVEGELSDIEMNCLTILLAHVIESDENMLILGKNPKENKLYYEFIGNTEISDKLREIIIKFANKFSYDSILFDIINRYIEVTKSRSEFVNEGDKCVLYLSLDYIHNKKIKLDYPIKLLGEDDSDSIFFKDLGVLYEGVIERTSLPYDTLQYKIGSSGGGTIATRINTEVCLNHEITIAIADSDKKYDCGEIGSTAQYLLDGEKELRRRGNCHFETMILTVQEKENLIKPSEYAVQGLTGNYIERYIEIENDDKLSRYLIYLDYKSGLEKYYRDLKEKQVEFDNFYSLLEEDFPEYRQLHLNRKCIECIDVSKLDLESPDKIVFRRKLLAKIFWSWGISKNSEYLRV